MTDTTDQQAVTIAQDEFATIEEWEHDDQRELSALFNHRADDSLQFNRGQMRTAIRHGKRLASVSSASADYVLVPRVPTLDMKDSATTVLVDTGVNGHTALNWEEAAEVWSAMLAASPEPVPATNQAGEVNIDQQADDYAAEYLMTTEGNDYEPTDWERELIVDALHGFIAGYWPAALATQPATSQEAPCVDPRGAQCGVCGDWFQHTSAGYCATCIRSFKVPDHALAATPTPPTLSENLREALKPFADAAADYDYHDGQPAFDEYPDASSLPEINDLTIGNLRAARAALAQVKAS